MGMGLAGRGRVKAPNFVRQTAVLRCIRLGVIQGDLRGYFVSTLWRDVIDDSYAWKIQTLTIVAMLYNSQNYSNFLLISAKSINFLFSVDAMLVGYTLPKRALSGHHHCQEQKAGPTWTWRQALSLCPAPAKVLKTRIQAEDGIRQCADRKRPRARSHSHTARHGRQWCRS